MPEYPLEIDPRMDAVTRYQDYPSFLTSIPDLYLRTNVPQEVKDHVAIGRKILEHCYFVYEFIDVAFTHVIIGLEKALRIKYKEITKEESKDKSFEGLTEWAHELSLFELHETTIVDSYRRIRNRKVHNDKNTLGGFVYLSKIMGVIGLINDLYEDVGLRKNRSEIMKSLKRDFRDTFNAQGVLSYNGKLHIIPEFYPVFINNKKTPFVYSLSFFPAYKFEALRKNHLLPMVDLNLTDFHCDVEKKIFRGTDLVTNQNVHFVAIQDDQTKSFLSDWLIEFNKMGSDTLIAQSSISISLDKFYQNTLNAFYKQD